MTALMPTGYCFRLPGKRQTPSGAPKRIEDSMVREGVPEGERPIRCRQCRLPITHPADRTLRDGSHRHTFANPHGIVFEIGCFSTARGCGIAGPASAEFVWFNGFTWQVALCSRCLNHLGWYFQSPSESFFGLILDQLIQN
jgi:hypothetical protein